MRVFRPLTAVAVVALAGLVAGVVALSGPVGASAAGRQPADDAQQSLVETYDYPGAANIQGIQLFKGDGHMMLVDCAVTGDRITVESLDGTGTRRDFCFQVHGPKGYLSMQLNGAYLIWTDNQTVLAKASVDGQTETKTVKKDDPQGVGVGEGKGAAMLLELRV